MIKRFHNYINENNSDNFYFIKLYYEDSNEHVISGGEIINESQKNRMLKIYTFCKIKNKTFDIFYNDNISIDSSIMLGEMEGVINSLKPLTNIEHQILTKFIGESIGDSPYYMFDVVFETLMGSFDNNDEYQDWEEEIDAHIAIESGEEPDTPF